MHFGLSDDQIFFQDNVKKFLEDNAPLDIIKEISNSDDSIIKSDLHKGIVKWLKSTKIQYLIVYIIQLKN